jgi:hypothetical protein
MAQNYPHRDARPPAMGLVDLGMGYLKNADLPQPATLLKTGLKALYDKAIGVLLRPLVFGATDLSPHFEGLSNSLNGNDMNANEFAKMLLDLFQIPHALPADIGYNVKTHLQSIFQIAPENLFRVIDNSELKMTIWKLVMTDINLVIYKNKHCNASDVQNYLGEDFCRFWDNTFRHTLSSTQLYSIIIKLTSIQPGMPPREITETLLKLFNNKLTALGEVSYNRLWKTNGSVPTDLAPFGPPSRPAGAGAEKLKKENKYLKYKAKYLALKNAMSQ